MSYPSGAPGGYPGQQQQQPYPGVAKSGPQIGLPQILLLVVAGLGVLNLFLGFATLAGDSGFYDGGLGWVPALLFAGGLTALFNVLPGDQKAGPWPAVLTLAGVLPFMFFIFSTEGDLEAGGVMIMIFGLLQMIAAIVGYLFDNGVIKSPQPQVSPYGQYGQYGQQYGQGPQSGGFPQQQQQQQTQYAAQQGQFYQQGPESGQRPPGA